MEAAREASRLAAPEVVLWRGPLTAHDPGGAVTLADRHRFHSAVLARVLEPCSEAVVFVLTVGAAIERHAQAMLADKLLLEAFLIDTAAWAAIESLVRALRRRLFLATIYLLVNLAVDIAYVIADPRIRHGQR